MQWPHKTKIFTQQKYFIVCVCVFFRQRSLDIYYHGPVPWTQENQLRIPCNSTRDNSIFSFNFLTFFLALWCVDDFIRSFLYFLISWSRAGWSDLHNERFKGFQLTLMLELLLIFKLLLTILTCQQSQCNIFDFIFPELF